LLGYRRADVHEALAEQRTLIERLAASLERTWLSRRRTEQQLTVTRARYEVALAAERAKVERTEVEARERAGRLVREAEEQAERLRLATVRRVGEAGGKLDSLLRVRQELLAEMRGLLDSWGETLERAEREAGPAPAGANGKGRNGFERVVTTVPTNGGAGESHAQTYVGHVELDAGPFGDLLELSAFEQSLAEVPAVDEVYVRGFAKMRAQIELELGEGSELVDDLREHLPYALEIRPRAGGRLTLDVGLAEAAAR
jgi:hypothetical protein